MKVIDFVKKINHASDDIPVEIKCGISDTVAVDKSLWHYRRRPPPCAEDGRRERK